MTRNLTILSLSALLVVMCAHKAAPLSKDRLSPRLLTIKALNNRQVQLIFSENIDTLGFTPQDLSITCNNDTLNVLAVYPSLSPAEIIAITDPQSEVLYEVSGSVFDSAQNKGNFKQSFSGTQVQDTIAPWVVGYSEGSGKAEFFIQFSEAMDTVSLFFNVIPARTMNVVWKSPHVCRIVPDTLEDPLSADTTYYLFLREATQDISGNKLGAFVTTITPDTMHKHVLLNGTVLLNDTLVPHGVAVLSQDITLGICLVTNGNFSFDVRDSTDYTLRVIHEDYSVSARVSARQDNTVILQENPKSIDSIIR